MSGNSPTPSEINQLNQLMALFNAGLYPELEKGARQMVEQRPNSGFAWNALGVALKMQGKDALSALQNSARLLPRDAEAQLNLGSALTDLGQLDKAAESYRRALAIRPDYAEAHRCLGSVLQYQGRIRQAEAHWQRALEIKPNYVEAMVCMAELLNGEGKFVAAEDLYRRAISVEPENPEAWSGIARCRKMTSADAAWLAAVEKIVEKNLPAKSESILRFAIGKYFDDVNDFDRAFLNYQRGNELSKHYSIRYDRQQMAQTVDLMIHVFNRDWVNRARTNANQSARPVFVVGMPRSGTSLAEQILASHPAVFGAGELLFWQAFLSANRLDALTGQLSNQALRKLAYDYLALLAANSPDALRVVNKMPSDFMALGIIRATFPNARIVHMRRNPIDTCLSIYFQNFQSAYSYANDLENIAHYYTQYCRLMEHWQPTVPQGDILDVVYEDLIDDQKGWSRKMIEFIGLPWDERCIDFHLTERSVQTASKWQVRQKINKTSVERWRNYEKYVGPLTALMI
jgi:tetratricopeptide (TPR) repeat protein